jgi:predicted nucleotide-binding protein (sugar kinase/HSP70/actin superfamily)
MDERATLHRTCPDLRTSHEIMQAHIDTLTERITWLEAELATERKERERLRDSLAAHLLRLDD